MKNRWDPDIGELSRTFQMEGRTYHTYGSLCPSLYQMLAESAEKFPDRTALADEHRQLTYAQFKREVDALAWVLRQQFDVKRGDVCAFLMYNSVDYCVCCFAVFKLGAIVLPLSVKFQTEELSYPLRHSRAKILFLEDVCREKVQPLLGKLHLSALIFSGDAPEGALRLGPLISAADGETRDAAGWPDGALLMYTSGTTGVPKGAYITHFSALHAAESYRRLFALTEKDSTVLSIPITYVTGMIGVLFTLLSCGGTVYLHRLFNAERTAACIQTHRLTFLHGSPTVFVHLLSVWERSHNAPAQLLCACGSANLPQHVLDGLYRVIPKLDMRIVYGLTETSSPATVMPADARLSGKRGCCGIPIPGMELRLVNGEQYGDGIGELQVRGSTVIPYYWQASADGLSSFSDGWFDTGDIARLDGEGCLYILDRKKDMINCGGEKIYCIEVENVLGSYPAVADCVVTAMPDPVKMEVPCAFIRLHPGMTATDEQLDEYLRRRLAKFKRPKRYIFVDDFPLGKSGKTLKRQLVREYLG